MPTKIDIQDIAFAALEALMTNAGALREMMRAEDTVLTIEDVLKLVPWSRRTVMKMVERRQIPMTCVEGRWIISRKAYREALERGFEAPKGVRTLKRK